MASNARRSATVSMAGTGVGSAAKTTVRRSRGRSACEVPKARCAADLLPAPRRPPIPLSDPLAVRRLAELGAQRLVQYRSRCRRAIHAFHQSRRVFLHRAALSAPFGTRRCGTTNSNSLDRCIGDKFNAIQLAAVTARFLRQAPVPSCCQDSRRQRRSNFIMDISKCIEFNASAGSERDPAEEGCRYRPIPRPQRRGQLHRRSAAATTGAPRLAHPASARSDRSCSRLRRSAE